MKRSIFTILFVTLSQLCHSQEISIKLNTGDKIKVELKARSSSVIYTSQGSYNYSEIDTIYFHDLTDRQLIESKEILDKLFEIKEKIKRKEQNTTFRNSDTELIREYILTENDSIQSNVKILLSNNFNDVTDSQIAKALLGRKHGEQEAVLDSLGVWYYNHGLNISIADGNRTVKIFTIKMDDEFIIDQVIINYSHDNIEQLEDLKSAIDYSKKHIGTYSTDIFFSKN